MIVNKFATVAELLASTEGIAVGTYVQVLDGDFFYRVAEASADDENLITAGGVKLYVLPTAAGFDVKAFGATGDFQLATETGTDDTTPVRAAFDAALATVSSAPASVEVQNAPCVFFSNGNYLLTSQIDVDYGIKIKGGGASNIIVNHNGIGFLFKGTAGVGGFYSRHKMLVGNLRFTRGDTTTTVQTLFQNGQDGASPTYLNSENGVHFVECVFDTLTCQHVFVNKRGFNIVFDRCYFSTIHCEAVIYTEQNNVDTPNWSYVVNLHSCDFGGILDIGSGLGGVAIRCDGGNLWMFGGLIQGCDGNAIELVANPNYLARPTASFNGVYWEANTGNHVETFNGSANINFASNWFVSGGRSNSFKFNTADLVLFDSCATPNNACHFDGGVVTLKNSTFMFGSKTTGTVLRTPEYVWETAGNGTVNFGYQLRIPGVNGGGHYLVSLSHYDAAHGGIFAVTTELVAITAHAGGTGFNVDVIQRHEGGANNVAFDWSYDPTNECAIVTASPVEGGLGNAFRATIVNHNIAQSLPL